MTFSIAVLCTRTGELGAALATSSMAAGGRALTLASGYGVVLAQADSDPRLGALGAALLETGRTAAQTLADMLASTTDGAYRQLAVIDTLGRVAHATGDTCLAPCGALPGRAAIALGNAVANDMVIPAMLRAYERAEGTLAHRLIAALEAGAAAGGEPHPLRSAALTIGRPGLSFAAVDLRIDLAEHPVADLRHLWRAYQPSMEGTILRVIDPAHAPPAAALNGHLRQWPVTLPEGRPQ